MRAKLKWGDLVIIGEVLLLAAVLFIPGLNTLFQATPLDGTHIAQIVGLAFLPTLCIQVFKLFRDRKEA